MNRSFSTFLVLVIIVTHGLSAKGQEEPPVQESLPVQGPNDPAELGAFIDGLMEAHLEAYESVGATISILLMVLRRASLRPTISW